MKIYIAASWRHRNFVLLLRDNLRHMGHTVLDWTEQAPPLQGDLPIHERRRLLDTDNERREIFQFCAGSCTSADLVIYLGPAGQDAACEIGIAHAGGVPVLGLAGALEAPGLVLNGCVGAWFSSPRDLLWGVYQMSNSLGEMCLPPAA